jgi:tryptophan 2,3-dioxygenase
VNRPEPIDEPSERITYRSVLGLDALLSLQPSDPEKQFFVVIHQAFELWFKQMIRDLDDAIADLARGESGMGDALAKLRRVAAVEQHLVEQMRLLSHLDSAAFMAFRDELGSASAAQSAQFHTIQALLGLVRDDRPCPLWSALSQPSDGAPEMRSQAVDLVDRITRTWLDLLAVHAAVVAPFIGDRAGTGGTSGVAYLKSHLRRLKVRAANARALVASGDDVSAALDGLVTVNGSADARC